MNQNWLLVPTFLAITYLADIRVKIRDKCIPLATSFILLFNLANRERCKMAYHVSCLSRTPEEMVEVCQLEGTNQSYSYRFSPDKKLTIR